MHLSSNTMVLLFTPGHQLANHQLREDAEDEQSDKGWEPDDDKDVLAVSPFYY